MCSGFFFNKISNLTFYVLLQPVSNFFKPDPGLFLPLASFLFYPIVHSGYRLAFLFKKIIEVCPLKIKWSLPYLRLMKSFSFRMYIIYLTSRLYRGLVHGKLAGTVISPGTLIMPQSRCRC